MKKSFLLILTFLFAAFASAEEKHQSYISYDDGGSVVKSGDDGREIEARKNLPIYPGDEIVTARRGRAEIRLSDGNILGIDRTTALLLRSILDSYEGDANETVVELRYGKVAIHRTDLGREHVRLDTDNASYVAENEGLYSVETDSKGRDRVTVFDGTVEVRTPTRATRLRSGESATIDQEGVFDLAGDQRDSADDFERWFLKRAERFGSFNSRYVDRRLGYWTDDLDEYGRWVMVSGIGWSWRPIVSVGWRPYYHGYWNNRGGCLTWVSYDPWGWGPYHYGRWAYDNGYGWVWVPGHGYSPAWVYWMYGSGYVGWAPSGWWDCYRPYYNWAYNPYRNRGWAQPGFGFYGRVRTNDFDLRPWTFVDSGVLISNRIDRAALTTDIIKQRLSRTPDGYATISGGAGRMTRDELRDPAEAIRRRGLDGRLTGRETGAPPTDITPFIRREPEVGGNIRDRIVRGRDGSSTVAGGATGPSRTVGGLAPIGRGSVAPIGRGSVAPIGGGSIAPIGGGGSTTTPATAGTGGGSDSRRDGTGGRVSRGGTTTPSDPGRATGGDTSQRDRGAWRDRVGDRPATQPTPTVTPSTPEKSGPPARDNSWRSRIRNDEETSRPVDRGSGTSSGSTPSTTGDSSDVPRRVIDGIGGARVVPRDSDRSKERERSSSTRDRSSSRDSGSRDRSSSDSGDRSSTRDSGNRDSGSHESARPSPPPSPPPSNSGNSNNSGNRESGGKIKRDQ